jgi:hypothetical protein
MIEPDYKAALKRAQDLLWELGYEDAYDPWVCVTPIKVGRPRSQALDSQLVRRLYAELGTVNKVAKALHTHYSKVSAALKA